MVELCQYYEDAQDKALEIIAEYEINRFPVDVIDLCKKMDIALCPYHMHKELILKHGFEFMLKKEGFATTIEDKNIIFYNSNIALNTNFLIAYELGCLVEGFPIEKSAYQEIQACIFACQLSAPACILQKLNIHTVENIMQICNLPQAAAKIALLKMEILNEVDKLSEMIKGTSCFLSSPLEQKVLVQFSEFIRVHT